MTIRKRPQGSNIRCDNNLICNPAPAGFFCSCMAKKITVTAGLVFRDGRLLITQRPPGGHLPGLWEFPGGKCEPGETLPECLQRELQEELGIAVNVREEVEAVTHAYPEKTVELHFFRCQLVLGEPAGLEGQALAWVTAANLDDYEFPAADAQLLDRLRTEADWWK